MRVLGFSGFSNSVDFKKKALPDLSPRFHRIAQGFDSAAALVSDGRVIAAAAEERFNRRKATNAFPAGAVEYCLRAGNIDAVGVDRLAHSFDYAPYRSDFQHSEFAREQFTTVYSREAVLASLRQHFPDSGWERRLLHVPHHLAHAASAFYLSGCEEALILVVDGMGEVHSMTVALGAGGRIDALRQVFVPHSLGILYSVFTLFLGFETGFDEYKLMALAAFGNPNRYFARLSELVQLQADGTYAIPILARNRTLREKETFGGTLRELSELFGPPRKPGGEITRRHIDIAAALQATLEATLLHVLRFFKQETGQVSLCAAGGVALNCCANGAIQRSRLFQRIFVQPAAGDDGAALGAAIYTQAERDPACLGARMGLPLWGPEYDAGALGAALAGREDCEAQLYSDFDQLVEEVARRLAAGQVVAWFQGRMEFGPRALGNRSLVADPRDERMRDRINELVKHREPFRPFAPAVVAEQAGRFFDIEGGQEKTYSYMLFVSPVREAYRSRLGAVTHVDGTARLQTVSREDNPRFWELLTQYGRVSGIPVLLNTSFNVRGQPIVCTPTEALDTFLRTRIDALALGDYLVTAAGDRRGAAERSKKHGVQ